MTVATRRSFWLICPVVFALMTVAIVVAPAGEAPEKKTSIAKASFSKDVIPLLSKYCIGCHGGEKPKGELSFEKFNGDLDPLTQPEVWEKVAKNLRSGDMPPKGKPKPAAKEKDVVLKWIETAMGKVDCTKQRDPGRVTIRRLNRVEYKN